MGRVGVEDGGLLTRPPLLSTQIAFLRLSMQSAPAMVGVIVEGGMCRRPGPSFKGMEGLVDVGRRSEGISSPGNTSCVAIIVIAACRVIGSCYRSIVEFLFVVVRAW